MFCIESNVFIGCTKCNYWIFKSLYKVNEIHIKNNISLEDIINDNLIQNEKIICIKCKVMNKEIIDNSKKTWIRFIESKSIPPIIFLCLELVNINHQVVNDSNLRKINLQNRINTINNISNFIKEKIIIYDNIYILRGIINTHQFHHYTPILMNILNNTNS